MPLSRIGTNSITNYAIGATDLANNSIETYTSNAGRPLTNRNLIINGAMQVAQRNTSVAGITTNGYYTADRWVIGISSAGTWTMNVESSAPTGTEFRKSANVICTTADSSLGAGDSFRLQQRFEGQNLQGIKKGTVNAESLTLSFYVKSSNTGTYICELNDGDNTRQISKSYTINTAHTWEKKTLTFPPDTTGQFDNDNATSLQLLFFLAAGTTFTSGTLNDTAWASETNANRAVGQLNLANLAGNYWAVTGVQLETGTVATPYEWMDYGTELSLCQRYFRALKAGLIGFWPNTTSARLQVTWLGMRATPSYTQSGTLTITDNSINATQSSTSVTDNGSNSDGGQIIIGNLSGATANRVAAVLSASAGSIFVSAEL